MGLIAVDCNQVVAGQQPTQSQLSIWGYCPRNPFGLVLTGLN